MRNSEPATFASSREGCAGFSLLPCHKRRFTYASALSFWLLLIIISLPSASALSKPSSPVIFIHGIASDAGAWSAFGVFLAENGWNFGGSPVYNRTSDQVTGVTSGDFYTINFSDNQHLHFDEQGFELAKIIAAVLAGNPGKTKVILVGHSMGGLAAREYLQGLARFNNASPRISYRGDVAKLVTVGTPHGGANIAFVCQALSLICGAFSSPIDPNSEAVEDLKPGSAAFLALNNLVPNPLPAEIPYVSIIGTGTDVLLDPLGFTEDGDGIVSASSQELTRAVLVGTSGLIHDSKPIFIRHGLCGLFVQTHTCETSDQDVWAELLRQLRPTTTNVPELSVTASPDPVRPAEFITYAYTVSNRGTTDLSGVELSTLVPDHTSVDPFSITGGGGGCGVICSPGEEVLWSLGTLFAGQSRTVQMAARVDPQPFVGSTAPPDGTLITNSAQVLHPGEGFTATDNTETRVCAGDGTECIHVVTLPLTFTDDPLTLQVTPIKAVHITELRQAINTLRSRNGLSTFAFNTDPSLTAGVTPIRAAHITEMRTALNGVFVALVQTPPTYTDLAIVAGQTAIKKAHIEEIRTAIRAVESLSA